MIIGLGMDVVDIARFERAITRAPALLKKIFMPEEMPFLYITADGFVENRSLIRSLAARWAAKEALGKALGNPGALSWHDAKIMSDEQGQPTMLLEGAALALFEKKGGRHIHVSLTHDAGLAAATVIVEG